MWKGVQERERTGRWEETGLKRKSIDERKKIRGKIKRGTRKVQKREDENLCVLNQCQGYSLFSKDQFYTRRLLSPLEALKTKNHARDLRGRKSSIDSHPRKVEGLHLPHWIKWLLCLIAPSFFLAWIGSWWEKKKHPGTRNTRDWKGTVMCRCIHLKEHRGEIFFFFHGRNAALCDVCSVS